MVEFIKENVSWIFSGIGVAILFAIIGFFQRKKKGAGNLQESRQTSKHITGNSNIQSVGNTMINITNVSPETPAYENDSNKLKQDLIHIVRKEQSTYVRESYGEMGHECFTDVDLEKFITNKVVERIQDNLKDAPEFLKIINGLKELPLENKDRILRVVRTCYKPTWAEIGRISREGQTDAGQTAERNIANAIADLVEKGINA